MALIGWVAATRAYLSTVRPLARLVWQAGPTLLVLSAFLTLLTGLWPTVSILVVSELLQTLVDASQHRHGVAASPRFVFLLLFMAAATVTAQAADRLGQTVTNLQGTRISNLVQLRIAEKAGSADLQSFEDREFHNRMQTVAEEAPFRPHQMVNELMRSGSLVTTLVSLGMVLLLWHVWVLLALLVACLGTLCVSMHFGSAQVQLTSGRAELQRRKHYLNTLLVSEQAAKEVRLFGLKDLLVGRFSDLLELLYRQDRRLSLRELAWALPAAVVLSATEVGLVAFTAVQALHGTIDVGQFNRYLLIIVQFGGQLLAGAFALGSLHESNLFAARLFGFLATEPHVEVPRPVTLAAGAITQIVFERVSFCYPGTERPVLTDVSFKVSVGESVAFVGDNGAGKSTVVKLLAGLYEPSAGRITIDGIDLSSLDRASLRSSLSVVYQDFVIYHLSARENVGFGRVDHLDDEIAIQAAALQSGLDQVLGELPNGYDTVLGRFWNSGHELSGGQRQLVALTRALVRQASVLVLDEPSSALDARHETEFFDQLLADPDRERQRCVIFVSHRLSTVRRADRILVLSDGRLTEDGTHEQLMSRPGPYSQMFRLQAAAFDDARTQAR